MPIMTLTPQYVNSPKPGKRYANINCNKIYYSFDPAKVDLGAFQKGVPIEVEVIDNNGFQNITRIVSTAAAGGTAARGDNNWTPEKVQGHRRLEIAKACIAGNVSSEVAMKWLGWVNAADGEQPE